MVTHPHPGFFDRFAERASQLVSRAWFFVGCVLVVLIWVPTVRLFGSIDTWQLIINTVTTIITFLLVALLQNSQWRGDRAANIKLDAIADGLADTMDAVAEMMRAMQIPDHERRMRAQSSELRRTVGLEEQISSSDQSTAEYHGEGGEGS